MPAELNSPFLVFSTFLATTSSATIVRSSPSIVTLASSIPLFAPSSTRPNLSSVPLVSSRLSRAESMLLWADESEASEAVMPSLISVAVRSCASYLSRMSDQIRILCSMLC